MSDSDALERLKNRSRPTVPSRDLTLTSGSTDTSIPRYQETQKPSTSIDELKTKQSTMRLEAGLSDSMQAICQDQRISREVLIEALFEYCEANPEAWQVVVTNAKLKADYRQKIANQRRAQSMMQKFTST